MTEPDTLLAGLLDAYIARDAGAMGAVLADDVRVWVTNAEGGVDPLRDVSWSSAPSFPWRHPCSTSR